MKDFGKERINKLYRGEATKDEQRRACVEIETLRAELAEANGGRRLADDALQQAQRALYRWLPSCDGGKYDDLIKNDAQYLFGLEHDASAREIGSEILAELAEARRQLKEASEQEPVAWRCFHSDSGTWAVSDSKKCRHCKPLYEAAPVPQPNKNFPLRGPLSGFNSVGAAVAQPAYAVVGVDNSAEGKCTVHGIVSDGVLTIENVDWQPAVPEAVAKDAARYRFLRECVSNTDTTQSLVLDELMGQIDELDGKAYSDALDTAIDAAILSTTEGRSNG